MLKPALRQQGKIFWFRLIDPKNRELRDQVGGTSTFQMTPSEDKRVGASLNRAVLSSSPCKYKAGSTLPTVQRDQFSGGWRVHSPDQEDSFVSKSAGVVPPHLHGVWSLLPTPLFKPETASLLANQGSAPNHLNSWLPHLTRYFREETVGLLRRTCPKLCRAWRALANIISTLASHHKQTFYI